MTIVSIPENSINNKIDSSNPLYIHPSDHPGMLLVSKVFDGSGFGAWKRAISIALSAKKKLGLVNGEIEAPTIPIQLQTWQRCNDMVISWLLNALSKVISESVLYAQAANQIWKELSDRYGKPNGAKLYQLRERLCDISQGNNDIATYFSKKQMYWDELNSLSSIHLCSCGNAQILAKRDEDQKIIQFIMGLNPTYDAMRSSILMMQPMSSISSR
ncbi:uncharacterized protein LOC143606503 [Bidens hawaiensis]|uniref:uncharacterized protein LOC143606503 n=1 Tax=Bidens hawaiensis TaxID=980011 RepID=UPI00404ADE5B